MARADFFSRSSSEVSAETDTVATPPPRPTHTKPPADLPWSPLQAGDSPAPLFTWKKASMQTAGPGLLLIRGLRRLTGTATHPDDPLGATNCDVVINDASSVSPSSTASQQSSSSNSSRSESVVRKRRRPPAPTSLTTTKQLDSASPATSDLLEVVDQACERPERAVDAAATVGCPVGVIVDIRNRVGTGSGPAARERMVRMMHRVLPDLLFSATVRVEATADEIGQTLHVNPVFVANNWILSADQRSANEMQQPNNHGSYRKAGISKFDSDPPTAGMTLETQLEIGLSRPIDQDVLLLALEKLAASSSISSIQSNSKNTCGMDKGASSTGIDFSCNNFLIQGRPQSKGLYHTAVSSGEIEVDWRSPAKTAAPCYVEFRVLSKDQCAGLCLGVYNANTDIRGKLVGSTPGSLGFHSDGKLIAENSWTTHGEAFGKGDTIGMLIQFHQAPMERAGVEVEFLHGNENGAFPVSDERQRCVTDESSQRPKRSNTFVEVSFTKNGVSLGRTSHRVFLPAEGKLRTAVSMYRPGSKVEMRCCLHSTDIPTYDLPTGTRPIC